MAERIDQRTRYLRDFATAMSHEFKTPLTGIRGAIELIGDHGDEMDTAQRRQFLDNATADADRLSRLVQRLLDLARADLSVVGEDAQCDVVAEIRAMAASRDGEMPVVRVAAPAEPVAAHVSRDTLETVLNTLIDNARQAGAGCVDMSVTTTLSLAVLTVADDGEGIAAADRARIFEPFFTARREQGGTGLGLPIARSLLSVTGGTIALTDGPGARFVIALPRA